MTRSTTARVATIGALAVVVAIGTRGLLLSIVGRKVDAMVATFAELAARLPAPRAMETSSSEALPPPPAVVASAIASTSPSAAPTSIAPRIASPLSKDVAPTPTKKTAPAGLVVTRAEVEDAIATKCHGVRASLVRDGDGAPIGLALHRVGALARFGVSEGDVVIAANGHPLRTPDEALAALGALKDASRVSVALRRGDATYVVTVEVAGDDLP